MALYRRGTASMDADGTVHGIGTKWKDQLALIRVGATIVFLEQPIKLAVISDIVSDTELKAISTDGQTAANGKYVILLNDSLTVNGLAQNVAETLRYYQSKETEIASALDIINQLGMDNLNRIVEEIKANKSAAESAQNKAELARDSANAARDEAKATKGQVQQIVDGAVGSINAAKEQAITDVGSKESAAITHIDTEEKAAIKAINDAKGDLSGYVNNAQAAAQTATSAKNDAQAARDAAVSSKDAAAVSAQEAADYAASLDTANLLRKDLNLSDLGDYIQSRTNLDVFSKQESLINGIDFRAYGDGEDGFNAAMSAISSSGGGTILVNEDITFTSIPINHMPLVTVVWNAKAIISPSVTPSSPDDFAYVMNGGADQPSYDNRDHFNKAGRTNCFGLKLIYEDWGTGINCKGVFVRNCYGYDYCGGYIIGFNNGAFYDQYNYEGRVSKFTALVSNSRSDTSIGVVGNSTDSWYSEIAPVGYPTGLKFLRSANSVDKVHPWGNTATNQVGIMGKMHVGIEITKNAGYSTYTNLILDTPVRRNSNNNPSRTNGGVGIICDAWECVIDGALVIPSRVDTVPKSTLVMITTTQKSTLKDIMVSDASYVNDLWISWEGDSGVLKNWVYGTGYAEALRNGLNVGANSGARLASVDGYAVTNSNLSSGVFGNSINYSLTASVVCSVVSNEDVVMDIAQLYGLTGGRGTTPSGARAAFFHATLNSGQQFYDVLPLVTGNNKVKFKIEFANGVSRFARWSDVLPSIGRTTITLSGIIISK